MQQFFTTLPINIINCFKGRLIIWHVLAILLTLILVQTGFDWQYYQATNYPALRVWMHPTAPIGFFFPIALPIGLFLIGKLTKHDKAEKIAYAVAQAEFIGWVISSSYKAITGRGHPTHKVSTDLSHVFHIGLFRGGIFWGWPSSHTTIAFAMAFAFYTLLPKQRWLGIIAIIYAVYIGIGVSMTIHWFSDFAAGAIIGTVVGLTVGKSFLKYHV